MKRGWRTSSVGPNEDYSVELLGVGERPGSERPSGCPEGGGLQHLVSIRN